MHNDWAELDYMISELYTKASEDISQPCKPIISHVTR